MRLRDIVRWATTDAQLKIWRNSKPIASYFGRESSVTIDLLWRQDPFQIERINVLPWTAVPDHIHPNVNSWEFALSGGGQLSVGHRSVSIDRIEKRYRFIPKNIRHGGRSFETGACWLSIQQWDVPISSILEDWQQE